MRHKWSTSVCCSQGFPAAVGWDPATGFGSVDYLKLYRLFVGSPSPSRSPTLTPSRPTLPPTRAPSSPTLIPTYSPTMPTLTPTLSPTTSPFVWVYGKYGQNCPTTCSLLSTTCSSVAQWPQSQSDINTIITQSYNISTCTARPSLAS